MSGPSPHATHSTQETSEILQFSCLFTHDIKRKKKRWQDGRLRCHTFNNRVMVYDLEGNLVDSQHRRTAEAVHEGDEFSLDTGVLVQVEEQKETARQDLTELVKRRRDKEALEAADSQARTASGMSLAQWRNRGADPRAPRARSIREVLASAAKTPGGRATSMHVLPRAAAAATPTTPQPARYAGDARPAKRQRVSNGTERYRAETPDVPVPRVAPEPPRRTSRSHARAAIDLTDDTDTRSPSPERRPPTAKVVSLPPHERSLERPKQHEGAKRKAHPHDARVTEPSPPAEVASNGGNADAAVQRQRYQPKNLNGRLQSAGQKRNKLLCAGGAVNKLREPKPAPKEDRRPAGSPNGREGVRRNGASALEASLSDLSETYEV